MEAQEKSCLFCGNDNASLCHYCRLVTTCQPHFHLHHYQGFCYPFKIIQKVGVGRCLVAARKITAGELILSDVAAAFGPRPETLKPEACSQCYQQSLYKCCCGLNVCRLCLKNHGQKPECKILQVSKYFDYEGVIGALTPLRLWHAQLNDRDLAARLDLLMDHNRFYGEDDDKCAENLVSITGLKEYKKDFLRCIGLLKTNAIEVFKHGRALFPTFSFLSHSCINNARHVIEAADESFKISLYAQVDIEANEEITITYINLLRPTFERQEQLEYLWHFVCQCSRCQDPTEFESYIGHVKCPQCQKVMLNNLDNQSFHCCQSVTYVQVKTLTSQFLQYFNGIVHEGTKIDGEKIQEFLSFTQDYLYENHYLRILAKRLLSQIVSDKVHKEKLCQELLRVFDKLDPGISHSRGMTLYELYKATSDEDLIPQIRQCLSRECKDSVAGKAYLSL